MSSIYRSTIYSLSCLLLLIFPSFTIANEYKEPTTGMDFVLLNGGSYSMGDLYGRGLKYERPVHKVTLPSFYMSKYEVTFDQYDKFCEATKRQKPEDEGWGRGNLPVINVSWEDAVAFADWLSKKTDRKFRLPSEAEWEFAARGGKGTDFWWGMQAGNNNANCKDCQTMFEEKRTTPVGSFTPNPFGLYDMNGNVYEWCQDEFTDSYKSTSNDGSPHKTGKTDERIMRGGSFYREAFEMRNSTRAWDRKNSKLFEYGIRLVLEQ